MSDDGINSTDWIFKKAKELEAENAKLRAEWADMDKQRKELIHEKSQLLLQVDGLKKFSALFADGMTAFTQGRPISDAPPQEKNHLAHPWVSGWLYARYIVCEEKQTENRVASSKKESEAFVVQLCHGDKADGLYYDGDGDWTNFENACTYYSQHDMEEALKEARQANEDKTAEVVAFAVILSRR